MIHHRNTIDLAVREGIYVNNYFHFILDTLFPTFCDWKKQTAKTIYVEYYNEEYFETRKQMFAHLFSETNVVYTKKIPAGIFRIINKDRKSARYDLYFSDYFWSFRNQLEQRIVKNPNELLLVARRNRRILENQKDLEKLCQQYFDTKVVYFEDMPWQEQISISKGSKVMIGMHGAGLMNSIFMRGTLIELLPGRFKQFHRFKVVNELCGNTYYAINGKALNETNEVTKLHGPQTVNLKLVESILKKLVS